MVFPFSTNRRPRLRIPSCSKPRERPTVPHTSGGALRHLCAEKSLKGPNQRNAHWLCLALLRLVLVEETSSPRKQTLDGARKILACHYFRPSSRWVGPFCSICLIFPGLLFICLSGPPLRLSASPSKGVCTSGPPRQRQTCEYALL